MLFVNKLRNIKQVTNEQQDAQGYRVANQMRPSTVQKWHRNNAEQPVHGPWDQTICVEINRDEYPVNQVH